MARRKKQEAGLFPAERLARALVPPEEQPYPVPENWRWVTVNGINRYSSASVDPATYPKHSFELYSVPSSAEDYPEIILGKEIGSVKQAVQKGDVLLCKINPRINRVWKVSQHTEHKLIASSEWIIIRNQNINSDYLMFCLRSPYFREYMLSNVSGVGGSLMRAQPKHVNNYPIPLPPLAEQQRIVDRIESLFAKLDEAREKAQAVVDGFEHRKAAILHKAFTGELTRKWREENGYNLDKWIIRTIKECCIIGSGGTPSRRNPEYYKGNIPWIKTGEINWNELYDAEEKITELAIKESSAKLYHPGVVLVAMYGMGVTRGRAAILKIPATTNQAVCALNPKEYISNKFLFYYFMYNYWNVRSQSVGGNQLNLSASIIGKFQISIPMLSEQHEITNLIDSLLEKEQRAKEAAEQVIETIDAMKKAILARAFRGELATNDPADESAEELLKQIL